MKIYHVVYELSFKSVDIRFCTKCTLACRTCYTRFETLDFGLFYDPIAAVRAHQPGAGG
jgi:predicted Rdx family selenoprotein